LRQYFDTFVSSAAAPSGAEAASANGAVGTLRVPDVHLWAPGDGYLYELEASLLGTAGEVVDSYRQPVGVRTVDVRGTQVLINGTPFYFKGFGKHEDAAVRGKRHDDVLMVHDFALVEWIGANSSGASPTSPPCRAFSATNA
jgi:beta-glucuronidase